jgi:hypothetical protein
MTLATTYMSQFHGVSCVVEEEHLPSVDQVDRTLIIRMFPQSNEIAYLKILEISLSRRLRGDSHQIEGWLERQRTLLHLSRIMTQCVDNAFLITTALCFYFYFE